MGGSVPDAAIAAAGAVPSSRYATLEISDMRESEHVDAAAATGADPSMVNTAESWSAEINDVQPPMKAHRGGEAVATADNALQATKTQAWSPAAECPPASNYR